MKRIGQEQFHSFTREHQLDRTKPIDDTIHQNKLKVFKAPTTKSVNKQKQQLTSLKNNAELFSWLYISCQMRDGDLEEFFCHENKACPPSLSDAGRLSQDTKSNLACLEEISEARTGAPSTTAVVLDGAAIVQILNPAACKNFSEYAYEIFIPTRLQSFSHHHAWTWYGTTILLTHSKVVQD